MNKLMTLAVAGTLMGVTAASFAAVKTAQVRPNNWSAGPAAAFVPLNAAGATTTSFSLAAPTRLVLTYSAECAVSAPAGNAGVWLDLDLIVNGVPIAPTAGNQDAFCSSNGTAALDGWTRASITVFFTGKTGANTVRIQSRGNGGATSVWLGDSSLVIHD
ncbi:MAG TPA: hypothetical protein VIT67_12470 [Povalibacter sp.]